MNFVAVVRTPEKHKNFKRKSLKSVFQIGSKKFQKLKFLLFIVFVNKGTLAIFVLLFFSY